MIPKISTGRGGTRRLLAYLYGPGRHNEHTNPHTIASWNDFAPEPAPGSPDYRATLTRLARQLDQPVDTLADQAPATTVWHCSLRTAPEDPALSDAQWAVIARRVLSATGIAPAGDTEACRWVAIRHAPDHIHIAATLVRQDGRPAHLSFDRKKAQTECRHIEADYGLRQLNPGDGTAAKHPTSREHFKAHRQGQTATPRQILHTHVRKAAAVAANEDHFFAILNILGVQHEQRHAPSGDVLGYKVTLPGHTNNDGQPVWYSGSTLAPDLSLPRLRAAFTTEPEPPSRPATAPKRTPWHQATAAVHRATGHLTRGTPEAAQGQLAALGTLLETLPLAAPPPLRTHLQHTATAFERATRSRIHADHQSATALRRAAHAFAHQPTDHDGAGLAMLLDTLVFAIALARHWHNTHQNAQQEAATHQALHHAHTAYLHAAEGPLTRLAAHAPPHDTRNRYAHHIRHTAPDHAEQILTDPAWPALTTTLHTAELNGHNPAELLQHAIRQRPLTNANNPAHVLTWRLHHLADHNPLSSLAQAARARSHNTRPTVATPTATYQPPPTAIAPRRSR